MRIVFLWGWNSLSLSMKSIWSVVWFKSEVSLLISTLDHLSRHGNVVWKSLLLYQCLSEPSSLLIYEVWRSIYSAHMFTVVISSLWWFHSLVCSGLYYHLWITFVFCILYWVWEQLHSLFLASICMIDRLLVIASLSVSWVSFLGRKFFL